MSLNYQFNFLIGFYTGKSVPFECCLNLNQAFKINSNESFYLFKILRIQLNFKGYFLENRAFIRKQNFNIIHSKYCNLCNK